MKELRELTIQELGARLRARTLRAETLAEWALSNMRLGAYRQVEPDLLRRQAAAADAAFEAGYDLGVFQGIPVSIKDLLGVPGFATCAGSPRPLPANFERPGPAVTALLRQLALVSGKTHTVEFAFGGLGTNPHYPTPVNPWDPEIHRAPGGSTAGGGVSLCEGSAFLALGTDTAGSVRIPASWTGNTALKTTHGRWSTEGVVPLSWTLDTVGILGRTTADLAVAFEVLDSGSVEVPSAPEPGRVVLGRGTESFFFEDLSPGVGEAVEEAVAELAGAGVQVRSLELPEVEPTYGVFKLGGPVAVELSSFLSSQLPDWLATLDPNVRARIGDAARLSAGAYLERLALMKDLARTVDARLRGVDAYLSPTVANSPPAVDELKNPTAYARQNVLSLRNTAVVSYLGLCAVTLPVGRDRAGMPVGLQLIGRAHSEPRLLAIAGMVEEVLGRSWDRLGRPSRVSA